MHYDGALFIMTGQRDERLAWGDTGWGRSVKTSTTSTSGGVRNW